MTTEVRVQTLLSTKKIIHNFTVLVTLKARVYVYSEELLKTEITTGWGQCIGTAIRGYCKTGVKDSWKWY